MTRYFNDSSFSRIASRAFATLALAGITLGTTVASAFPLTSERAWDPSMTLIYESGFHFDAIVAMSNCSASFVRFKGSSDDAKGLVLTNGHCIGSSGPFGGGMLQPGEVVVNRAKVFNVSLLNKSGQKLAALRADTILYATMTDTDVALLQLDKTYREIFQSTGVQPLWLADSHPTAATQIEIASGYWKRTYSCAIDGFAPYLKEDNWTFKDSIRYSAQGCDVIGGTSGSPVISPASGEVIGINNTINESGQSCTLNNPCESDGQGHTQVLRGRGYAQQTYLFYSCLNADRRVDISVGGCVLPKPQ